MTLRLDAEEQEFLQSFESGEWVSAPDRDEILERHRRAASATAMIAAACASARAKLEFAVA